MRLKRHACVSLLLVVAALAHQERIVSAQALRDRIDAITDGLVARYGGNVLNTCPQSPVRIATLNCTGCTWDSPGASPMLPEDSCAIELSVDFYDSAAVSSIIYTALVIGTIVTFLAVPQSRSNKLRLKLEVSGDFDAEAPKPVHLRRSFGKRAKLTRLWVIYFCANFFFAFLISYIVLCEASVSAQVHEATVLTLQIGLLAYTLHEYLAPIGRELPYFRLAFYQTTTRFVGALGAFLFIVLSLLVVMSWLCARRFSNDTNLGRMFPGVYSEKQYNLCFLNATEFAHEARWSTYLQYAKGVIQVLSAVVFLLGEFTIPWAIIRFLNLIAAYGLFAAQLYIGRPVLRVTGPFNLITEALAFDFVEISVAHLFAVLGLFEHLETCLSMRRSSRDRKHHSDVEDATSTRSPLSL
jgi:hypothetical protein